MNAANGPFAFLLASGRFFAAGADDAPDAGPEWSAYFGGKLRPPVDVYFTGGYGRGAAAVLKLLEEEGAKAAQGTVSAFMCGVGGKGHCVRGGIGGGTGKGKRCGGADGPGRRRGGGKVLVESGGGRGGQHI